MKIFQNQMRQFIFVMIKKVNSMLRFNYFLIILSALLILTVPASCEENQKNETPKIPASLEEAKTAEEAYAYIEHIFRELRAKVKTEEDENQFKREYSPIGIAGADKIIALAKNDKELEDGYGIKLYALGLSLNEKPENEEKIDALFEEIAKTGKFPEIIMINQYITFFRKWKKLDAKTISLEQFEQLKSEAKTLFLAEQKQELYSEDELLTYILDFAKQIETEQKKTDFLDSTLKELIQFLQSEPVIKIYGEDVPKAEGRLTKVEKLQGYCRRMVGSLFELNGKTTDGKDFSWNDYKGKFVLIDFTASWCGPCRAEMPNLLEVYEKYHDKGFDIISIGVWDSTENLKKQIEEDKISWVMISEELSRGDSDNLASKRYGLSGVPTIFLVGKDGKIISSGLRGAKLYSTISKLFEEK